MCVVLWVCASTCFLPRGVLVAAVTRAMHSRSPDTLLLHCSPEPCPVALCVLPTSSRYLVRICEIDERKLPRL